MQSPAVVPTRGLQLMLACNEARCDAGVPTRRGAIYAGLPDKAGHSRRQCGQEADAVTRCRAHEKDAVNAGMQRGKVRCRRAH